MGERLEQITQQLHSGVNRLNFALRHYLRRGRGCYVESAETKDHLFANRENALWLADEAGRLGECYQLEHLWNHAGRTRYLENLNVLQTLECLVADEPLPAAGGQPLTWLDVGAKNGSYAEALYRFLSAEISRTRTDSTLSLYGIEIDAYRRYIDGHNRLEYADAFTRHLPDVHFLADNVLHWSRPLDGAVMFLPFVFKEPCLDWGLPGVFFGPEVLLRHVVDCLRPGGVLLITNQGEDEALEQHRLLTPLVESGLLSMVERGRMPDSFLAYRHERYGWFCRKTDNHTG